MNIVKLPWAAAFLNSRITLLMPAMLMAVSMSQWLLALPVWCCQGVAFPIWLSDSVNWGLGYSHGFAQWPFHSLLLPQLLLCCLLCPTGQERAAKERGHRDPTGKIRITLRMCPGSSGWVRRSSWSQWGTRPMQVIQIRPWKRKLFEGP